MTEIKSALELALERTQDVQGNPEALKLNEVRNEGKKLASAFLDPGENVGEHEVAAKKKSCSPNEAKSLREGFGGVMLANLTLPVTEGFAEKLKNLESGINAVLKERKQVSYIFQQVSQFFSQYLQSREQLETAIKQQYEPRLREKEQTLEKQMGGKVNLTHEQDQEFVALLAKNYAQLEAQYSQALQQAKEQLKQMLDSAK